MIVSRDWLQRYFEATLPDAAAIADALTFHAFEIESAEGDMIDVKVLPNRAADCLSHLGIAKELRAILELPMKSDPLREALAAHPATEAVTVDVEDARACPRYMAALIRGVKVGPSPKLLKEALEAVGQRSINNVVDATNFVMLDIGQPLHAFDAARLTEKDGNRAILVRGAREGETMTTLSGEELVLSTGSLVITDAHADAIIGLAGVKGGRAAEITDATTDIIIEAANFDAAMVRRAMQKAKLFTEAGKRFQNDLSPELAGHGMKAVIDLILFVAGGTLEGVVDRYPAPPEPAQVPCSVARINAGLGTSLTGDDVAAIYARLGFAVKRAGDDFTVDPPFERRDITIPQDLVEEVGRIWGYDRLPALMLPPLATPPDQARFRGIERMKDQLVAEGFTEVSTQSFAKKGDVKLANPLDVEKPYLRTSLEENIAEALKAAKLQAPLVLPPNEKPKLFEVGTVFPAEGEFVELRMSETVPAWGENFPTHDNLSVAKLEEYGKEYEPIRYELSAYKPFSVYPFIVRDVAVWAALGTDPDAVKKIIDDTSSFGIPGAVFIRTQLFDRFEKADRVSLAFRIVYQALGRTLTDEEVNGTMERVHAALRAAGYEVR